MSTIKIDQTTVPLHRDIVDVFEFPNFRRANLTQHPGGVSDRFAPDGFRVEAVTSDDQRVAAAREIEVEAMSMLGDPPEEVRTEFVPYNQHSLFYLAFAKDAEGTIEDIAAMGRTIPYHPDSPNKTIHDLAIIPGWEHPDLERTDGVDVAGNPAQVYDPGDVAQAFYDESGCTSLEQVWDIATMAPTIQFVTEYGMKPHRAGMSILAAAAALGIQACVEGKITHVTSFNEAHAHGFFTRLGYPFGKMFGLEPILYDSFGSQEGMVAQPAWFDVREFTRTVASEPPETYLGVIASALRNRDVL